MDDGRLASFEAQRQQLRSVAYRMLGSVAEAEDAVQEAWVRLQRSDTSAVTNLGGWLTTVVARICLDALRTRASRREDPLDVHLPDPVLTGADVDPEREAVQVEQVGLALMVLLDALPPVERVAYVLHDLFDVPFPDIAPLVERTATATRQLASRARRRVQEAQVRPDGDLRRQRVVVDAFLAAARGGDLAALVSVLHPDVVLLADLEPGLGKRLRGAEAVAGSAMSFRRAGSVHVPVLVDGVPGVVTRQGAEVASLLSFTVVADLVVQVHVLADPARLRALGVADLPAPIPPAPE